MHKYLHIGLGFGEETVKRPFLVEMFNEADDWMNYIPSCWILYTDRTPAILVRQVKKMTGNANPTFFICELDLENRQGWMTSRLWDWIK
jgi:hypothetical protein